MKKLFSEDFRATDANKVVEICIKMNVEIDVSKFNLNGGRITRIARTETGYSIMFKPFVNASPEYRDHHGDELIARTAVAICKAFREFARVESKREIKWKVIEDRTAEIRKQVTCMKCGCDLRDRRVPICKDCQKEDEEEVQETRQMVYDIR